ncbi:MAG: SMI1/KNR4 family protein [Oscillospiraceae bacterium]|nr:SMI1/KNR4 family protein [Oscillospiraceae bacterium]
MEWEYVRPLQAETLVDDYEKTIKYEFPEEFVLCVKHNNNGYPKLSSFISWKGKRKRKRVFDHLFSFNTEDRTTIWNYNDWNGRFHDWNENGEMNDYVAFAGDPFGNLICFDKTNDHIVFIDHETLEIEDVADNFSDFINNLRKK